MSTIPTRPSTEFQAIDGTWHATEGKALQVNYEYRQKHPDGRDGPAVFEAKDEFGKRPLYTCTGCRHLYLHTWRIEERRKRKMSDFSGLTFYLERAIDRLDLVIAPHRTFTPRLFIDGNMWCALYGDDLQVGIAGFGETPHKAVMAFDDAFYRTSPPHPAQDAEEGR